MIGEAGRARAATILDDTCTVTRAADEQWTPENGLPTGTVPVYSGRCALLAPAERRHSDEGADERVRTTHILAVPVDAGPFRAGDAVTVASAAFPLFVVKPDERSHRVLQRVQVASTTSAQGAPR